MKRFQEKWLKKNARNHKIVLSNCKHKRTQSRTRVNGETGLVYDVVFPFDRDKFTEHIARQVLLFVFVFVNVCIDMTSTYPFVSLCVSTIDTFLWIFSSFCVHNIPTCVSLLKFHNSFFAIRIGTLCDFACSHHRWALERLRTISLFVSHTSTLSTPLMTANRSHNVHAATICYNEIVYYCCCECADNLFMYLNQ